MTTSYNVKASPVAISERLEFVSQTDNLKTLKKECGSVVSVAGEKVNRDKFNAFTDQAPTTVFNNSIGFMVMPTDEWLALEPYEANREWLERFKGKDHLRGLLTSPLQTLCFALVDESGKPICRLDGNGRTGAWLAGGLEKPEFVHVLTVVLPKGLTQGSYFVSNLFDILNGDKAKQSTEHKAEVAQKRYGIKGEWVEFESGFVKSVQVTAFRDVKKFLVKPVGTNETASDFMMANQELVYLIDSLGLDADKVLGQYANAYTSTIFSMMLQTMRADEDGKNGDKVKLAYKFWSQWKPETTDPIISGLYNSCWGDNKVDQSGAKAKKAFRETILEAVNAWALLNKEQAASIELPSFEKWFEAKYPERAVKEEAGNNAPTHSERRGLAFSEAGKQTQIGNLPVEGVIAAMRTASGLDFEECKDIYNEFLDNRVAEGKNVGDKSNETDENLVARMLKEGALSSAIEGELMQQFKGMDAVSARRLIQKVKNQQEQKK